eukprot:TRINITY_DN2981_c0_g2_i2.p1 TRINITY_DN2981_c0_g2~~TRINITY_DN2981_c0_g2_i2.p1  ORF type:complete len:115 (+),score=9.22 TRINITY_DN2981_c0_g2_i2:946-1290(+)
MPTSGVGNPFYLMLISDASMPAEITMWNNKIWRHLAPLKPKVILRNIQVDQKNQVLKRVSATTLVTEEATKEEAWIYLTKWTADRALYVKDAKNNETPNEGTASCNGARPEFNF